MKDPNVGSPDRHPKKGSQSGADSTTSSIWQPNLIPPSLREFNQGRYKPDAGYPYNLMAKVYPTINNEM